jgi:fructokinase
MQGYPLIFGEVLFDCFEDGSRVLGGAPFNVAWNLQALGAEPLFVSRVGDDAPGRLVRDRMQHWGMGAAGVQLDTTHPTGSVEVGIRDGEPAYEIVTGRAWEHIEPSSLPSLDVALIYHGSLALRSATNAVALERLVASHPAPLFVDVNLRPPWWQTDALHAMLDRATFAKLNEQEVDALGGNGAHVCDRAEALLVRHRLDLLFVTRGPEGAFALGRHGDSASIAPGKGIQVVDTVGAGDAFASVAILGLLRGWPLGTTLERAQAFASAMIGVRGATVDDPCFYQPFRDGWGL